MQFRRNSVLFKHYCYRFSTIYFSNTSSEWAPLAPTTHKWLVIVRSATPPLKTKASFCFVSARLRRLTTRHVGDCSSQLKSLRLSICFLKHFLFRIAPLLLALWESCLLLQQLFKFTTSFSFCQAIFLIFFKNFWLGKLSCKSCPFIGTALLYYHLISLLSISLLQLFSLFLFFIYSAYQPFLTAMLSC